MYEIAKLVSLVPPVLTMLAAALVFHNSLSGHPFHTRFHARFFARSLSPILPLFP